MKTQQISDTRKRDSFLHKNTFILFLAILFFTPVLKSQSFVYHLSGNSLEIDVYHSTSVPISTLSLTIPLPEGYLLNPESNANTQWTPGWFCPEGNCSDTYTLPAWKEEFHLSAQTSHTAIGSGIMFRIKGIIVEVDDIILRQGKVHHTDLVLYPNPGFGKFILEFPQAEEYLLHGEWFDLQGRVVEKVTSNSGTSVLQSSHLPAGIYTLRIQSNLSTYLKRVVKN